MVAQRRTCGVGFEVAMMFPFQCVRKNTMAWGKRGDLMRINAGRQPVKNVQAKKKTAEAVFLCIPQEWPADGC
jgi:hypothetical protein